MPGHVNDIDASTRVSISTGQNLTTKSHPPTSATLMSGASQPGKQNLYMTLCCHGNYTEKNRVTKNGVPGLERHCFLSP